MRYEDTYEGQKALRKRLRKIREMPLDHEGISPREAGRILGMSRSQFMRRMEVAYYDHIPRVHLRGGWLFDLLSVMQTAYPKASKDKISEFIRDYRESLFDRRGRKR